MNNGESAFWRFSLRFYARDGVAPLCLELQDQHGVDVNLLFFVLYFASQQRRINIGDAQKFDQAAATWRTRVVQPLRALRRDLKNGVAAMDPQATEALRSDIKRSELHAERLQQKMLEHAFPLATTGTPGAIPEAAAANIAAYGAVVGTLPDDLVKNLLRLFAEEFGLLPLGE